LLQVDGYAGFNGLVTDPAGDAPQLAFCRAHTRREFHDIFAATKAPLAEEGLRRIAALYAVEIDLRGQPAEERQRVRQQESRPLVEAMRVWLNETLGRISGRSALAQAIRYALNHWEGLILFLDDGRLELDTNTASAPSGRSRCCRNYVRSRIMCSSFWRRSMRPNGAGDFTRRRH
jgi:hypothetical protein